MTTLIDSQKTVYTGDKLQGTPVISQLDVNDLELGKKHRFFFQGVQMGTGQHWYVPVVVAKGARSGKQIALVVGVHGDDHGQSGDGKDVRYGDRCLRNCPPCH